MSSSDVSADKEPEDSGLELMVQSGIWDSAISLACSRLRDCGEINVERTEERTWKKFARDLGREQGGGACKHFFTDPLPPTFDTSGLIRFLSSKFSTVN